MEFGIYQGTDFSDLDLFGIGMSQYPGRQNHIAIIFKDRRDDVNLMHVGQHKGPLLEPPSEKYIWFNLGDTFHPIRKQVMLALLWQIAEENSDSKVSYGLNHGLFCIDPESGRFNSHYTKFTGFTCATFVIEVFLSFGIQLVDWDSWPEANDDDVAFQNKVLDYLAGRLDIDVTVEYLISQGQIIGGARFRPEEVGASTQIEIPASWHSVRPGATHIASFLNDYADGLRAGA